MRYDILFHPGAETARQMKTVVAKVNEMPDQIAQHVQRQCHLVRYRGFQSVLQRD